MKKKSFYKHYLIPLWKSKEHSFWFKVWGSVAGYPIWLLARENEKDAE